METNESKVETDDNSRGIAEGIRFRATVNYGTNDKDDVSILLLL